MVDPLALGIAVTLTLAVAVLHFLPGPPWTPREDVTDEVLERRARTVSETEFPAPMNRAIGAGGGAVAVGGEAEGELEEGEEAPAEETTSPADIPDDEVENFDVEYVKEGETVAVANNETLLEAGEDEGWDLPYACREGQCLSCGGHVVDGDAREYVEHDGQEMLDDEELANGYVLTCVAYPRGEFSLETSETP
ncbi:2Fe-2S iron-sulfur cluster-binding protein [Salinilacihabitans rarus]|uniref:2Fe-2S iron-sulfur cluster-binding protein n=1 Tax=Salinilacihabitans rarus TaxID=2961596 RepID=UPI0020C8B81E|nr:2Fe-2S iron-sulfur cluster-binding protein [Salinilacihabitans rarus]